MYIETEKLLSVQIGDKEIVYKPDPTVEKRKVLYSWLTEEQIEELIETTRLQNFIDSIDEEDINHQTVHANKHHWPALGKALLT